MFPFENYTLTPKQSSVTQTNTIFDETYFFSLNETYFVSLMKQKCLILL